MRPVDLTGRPLGICKLATRYRVNPCPTPPPFSPPIFFPLSTSFPSRPDRGVDGNFCHENRHFSPQQAELRLPREDEWQRWMVAGPPAPSPPQEPRKMYCFALETSSINLAWTLNFILWSRQNDSKTPFSLLGEEWKDINHLKLSEKKLVVDFIKHFPSKYIYNIDFLFISSFLPLLFLLAIGIIREIGHTRNLLIEIRDTVNHSNGRISTKAQTQVDLFRVE